MSRFTVPDGSPEAWLRYRTFRSGFALFRRLLPELLGPDDLPVLPGTGWSDRDCSERAYRDLKATER